MVVTCPGCRSQLQVPDELVASTLRCTQCQTQFRVGDAAAPGAPPPAPGAAWGPPPGPPPPPAPRGTSAAAVTSLILGIVGLLTCCLGPILAIPGGILGFVGISATGAGKKGGRAMAIIGLVLNAMGFLIVIPFTIGGFMYAKDFQCYMNMMQIGQTSMSRHPSMDELPANLDGHALLAEWAVKSGVDSSRLTCPKCAQPYRGPRRRDGTPPYLAACANHRFSGSDVVFFVPFAGGPPQMSIRGQSQPGMPQYEDVLDATSP